MTDSGETGLRRWVAPTIFALALWAVLATAVALWSLRDARAPTLEEGTASESVPSEPDPEEALPPELRLLPASFADLPGWQDGKQDQALGALLASCGALDRVPGERSLAPAGVTEAGVAAIFGVAADWQAACAELRSRRSALSDPAAVRDLLERLYAPWAAGDRDRREGLFTGYYEPTLRGSRRPGEAFRHPLYRRPPELVAVDLGAFRDGLAGERLAGRVEGGRLLPFADRAEVDGGALTGRGLELAWVDDPIDAFFLHIQGSGRIELAEGGVLRVGYAGQNGHVYTAIGRELIARDELTREEVSMQSIRRWLTAHPEQAAELMAVNRSYVFFRQLSGPGPLGSQGVALTPGRSLAVDRTFLPLGAPVWIDTSAPAVAEDAAEGGGAAPVDRPLRRLVIAQDTGGAIRGPVRGDVFWGPGDRAADIAGRMKHPGRLWLLLPRASSGGVGLAAQGEDHAADD